MDDSTVESMAGSTPAAPEPTEAPAATEAPQAEAPASAPESAPEYVLTVGTADNPAHVIVDNAGELTAPLLVPLGLILFSLGIVGGSLLGKALNWWKW